MASGRAPLCSVPGPRRWPGRPGTAGPAWLPGLPGFPTPARCHPPAHSLSSSRGGPPQSRSSVRPCRRQLGAPIPPVSRRESRGRRALIINHRRGSSRALSDARRAPGSSCTIAGAAAPRGSQGERKRRGNNPETFVLDCAQVREGSSLVPPS